MTATTYDRILDALEQLLHTAPASQVPLEAVAREAGISKGGLLHHFPTKEALLAALVRRVGERANAQLAEAVAGGTSVADFYLQTPDENSEANLALIRSAIAALRTNSYDSGAGQPNEVHDAIVDVMRAWDSGLHAEIDDPVRAEIVRLVGDGLLFAGLLGLPQPSPELHRQVVDRLLRS